MDTTEAMAMLVMGKCPGQCSTDHTKEQEAAVASRVLRTPRGRKEKGVSLATAKNQMAHRALCERIKVARSADGMKVRESPKVAQEGEGDESGDATATCQGRCDRATEILIKAHSEQVDGASNRGGAALTPLNPMGFSHLGDEGCEEAEVVAIWQGRNERKSGLSRAEDPI
jgi:hypothetical protein